MRSGVGWGGGAPQALPSFSPHSLSPLLHPPSHPCPPGPLRDTNSPSCAHAEPAECDRAGWVAGPRPASRAKIDALRSAPRASPGSRRPCHRDRDAAAFLYGPHRKSGVLVVESTGGPAEGLADGPPGPRWPFWLRRLGKWRLLRAGTQCPRRRLSALLVMMSFPVRCADSPLESATAALRPLLSRASGSGQLP